VPKVSVIMPAFNCGKYIDESIKSVLNQSYRDLELIVIDDGSIDDTAMVVRKYSGNPKIRYVRNSAKKGPSAARNKGIGLAEGDFITFLDADDIFLKHKVVEQLKVLEKKGACAVCYANEIYFTDDAAKEIVSNYYHFSGDVFYYLKRSNFIAICSMMAKSEILKEHKFDEDVKLIGHEDWELFLRLAYKGINFLYIDKLLTKIRIRPDSTTVSDIMINSRRAVGLKARAYWKEFKKSMNPFTVKGRSSILRYLKFKTGAFLIGFPKKECFNKPVARRLLNG